MEAWEEGARTTGEKHAQESQEDTVCEQSQKADLWRRGGQDVREMGSHGDGLGCQAEEPRPPMEAALHVPPLITG